MKRRLRRSPHSLLVTAVAAYAVVALLAACSTQESHTFQLEELNNSGVTGTAVLTNLGNGSTRVVVDVDPAGHPDMPSHVHHGTCADLVPQPLHYLNNVVDGKSDTTLAIPLDELLAGDLALNLHVSAADMGTYSACVDLN